MFRTGIYVWRSGRWVAYQGRAFMQLQEARAACLAMVDDVMGRGAQRCVAYVLDSLGIVRHERYSWVG